MLHQAITLPTRHRTAKGCGPALRHYVPIAMANNPQTGPRTPNQKRLFNEALQAIITALRPLVQSQIQRKRLTDLQEDALQAANIAVVRALHDYDPARAQFQTHFVWKLNEQLKRLDDLNNHYERKQDQRRRIETEALDPSLDHNEAFAVDPSSVEDNLEQSLSQRNLKNMLDVFQTRTEFLASQNIERKSGPTQLDKAEIQDALEIMQQCLIMRDLQDKSFEEISASLGLPRHRAKTILDYMHKELADIAQAALRESASNGINLLQANDHIFWQKENQRQSRKILNLIVGMQKDMQASAV